MNTELEQTESAERKNEVKIQGGASDTFYGLGLIGAWVYYIGRATTIEERIKGFFKGIVWPAFLVYELFVFLNED
jgi:hypothetical protein